MMQNAMFNLIRFSCWFVWQTSKC